MRITVRALIHYGSCFYMHLSKENEITSACSIHNARKKSTIIIIN